jgi:hypothetical protein
MAPKFWCPHPLVSLPFHLCSPEGIFENPFFRFDTLWAPFWSLWGSLWAYIDSFGVFFDVNVVFRHPDRRIPPLPCIHFVHHVLALMCSSTVAGVFYRMFPFFEWGVVDQTFSSVGASLQRTAAQAE